MLCCREAAKRMSTKHGGKGGAIVNVSSMAATIGGRLGSSAYAATKGAVDSFTKGFAREVAAEGIRVNSLRPGMVMTEMTEGRLKDAAFRASIEASIPMRRVGEVHEIAERHPVAAVGRGLVHHRRDARCGRRRLHLVLTGRQALDRARVKSRGAGSAPRLSDRAGSRAESSAAARRRA